MAAGGWRVTRGGSSYNLQEESFVWLWCWVLGVAAKKIAGTSKK
jgi:hypothetical protein